LRNNYGAKNILNSEAEDFEVELTKLISELKPLVFFEYIGGELPYKVFTKMPAKSQLVIVGNMTNEDIKLSSMDILMKSKNVTSLFVPNWIFKIPDEER